MCVATFPLLLGGVGAKVVTHTPASSFLNLLNEIYSNAFRNDAAFEAFIQQALNGGATSLGVIKR